MFRVERVEKTTNLNAPNLFLIRRCICTCVCVFLPFGYLRPLVNIKDEKNIFWGAAQPQVFKTTLMFPRGCPREERSGHDLGPQVHPVVTGHQARPPALSQSRSSCPSQSVHIDCERLPSYLPTCKNELLPHAFCLTLVYPGVLTMKLNGNADCQKLQGASMEECTWQLSSDHIKEKTLILCFLAYVSVYLYESA